MDDLIGFEDTPPPEPPKVPKRLRRLAALAEGAAIAARVDARRQPLTKKETRVRRAVRKAVYMCGCGQPYLAGSNRGTCGKH